MAHQPRKKKKIWTNYWRGWNAMSGWQTSSLNNPNTSGMTLQALWRMSRSQDRLVIWSSVPLNWQVLTMSFKARTWYRWSAGAPEIMTDAVMLLVRVTELQRLFPHHVDRAPTGRPQTICQSLTAPILLATAPTVRLWGRTLERVAAERQSLRYDTVPNNSLIATALRIQLWPTS